MQSKGPPSSPTGNNDMNSRTCLKLGLLVLLAMNAVACADPQVSSTNALPDYANKRPDGTVQIDVSQASAGSASLGEKSHSINFQSGDRKTRLRITAWSYGGGIGHVLSDPPINISPLLTPGDGVADFFPSVWTDIESEQLHLNLFFDVDWQSVAKGGLSIFTFEFATGVWVAKEEQVSIDLSEAVDGVVVHALTFTQGNNLPGYIGSPIVLVSNMSGKPADVLKRAMRLEVQKK